MSLLAVLAYLLVIVGVGVAAPGLRRLPLAYALLGGWIIGSVIAGFGFFVLSQLGLISTVVVSAFVVALAIVGAVGWHRLLAGAKMHPRTAVSNWWSGLDQWDRALAITCGISGVILLLDAWTPPRGADSMRYHLAQLEDIVRNGGFVYRPYFHYNFPLYFSYLALPLYMAVGGLGVKLMNLPFAVLVLAITAAFSHIVGIKRPLIPVLGILLTPTLIRIITTTNNDLGVIGYALSGALLLHAYPRFPRTSLLVLGWASLGFAMGIKYQSALFVPWYLWLTWVALGRQPTWPGLRILSVLGLIVLLIPSPFFIRNYLNTGSPDWPLHQELFGVEQDYLYEVTTLYGNALKGSHDWRTTTRAIRKLVVGPLFLPSMWLFTGLAYWRLARRRFEHPEEEEGGGLYLVFGSISFFVMWWILQPTLYARFASYIVPHLLVIGTLCLESLRGLWSRRIGHALAGASAAAGFAFLLLYSWGYLRYQIDRDLERYHESTRFYAEYRWIGEHLPDDARILSIVSSGHTYYLPRDYLRADPFLAATIDWRGLDIDGFRTAAAELGITHVLYVNQDWSEAVGGESTMRVMNELAEQDDVLLRWKRTVKLGTKRMLREFYETEVWLLELPKPVASAGDGV